MNSFYRIRYSPLGRLLASIKHGTLRNLVRESTFFKRLVINHNISSRIIYDIGASDGSLIRCFLRGGNTIIAVEPDERNFQLLTLQFGRNECIKLLNMAVGANSGKVDFYQHEIGHTLSTTQEKWKLVKEGKYKFSKKEIVKQVDLPSLFSCFGKPTLLKIDAEGSEKDILTHLIISVPLIFLEANLPHYFHETLDIIDYLDKLNPYYRYGFYINYRLISEPTMGPRDAKECLRDLTEGSIDISAIIPWGTK